MAEENQAPAGKTETPSAAGTPAAAASPVKAAEDAIAAAKSAQDAGTPATPPTDRTSTSKFDVPGLTRPSDERSPEGIKLLDDVALNVKIELGRTRMLVEDVLRLGEGSVVELDKLAGDPVDVYVNDRPVARGEVLVLNDNFCVRINEILSPPGAEAA